MSEIENIIKERHKSGLRGIVSILKNKGTFKKIPFIISLCLSIIIGIGTILFAPHDSLNYLKNSVDLVLSFFPSLLGFSLGGYALVVGFSNLELIKAGTKVSGYSVYQKLNAIFCLCIFFQVIATIISFMVSWVIKVDIFSMSNIFIGFLGVMVNGSLLLLLIFFSLYSLLLTPYVVTNLFTLSQVNNLFLTIEKLKEKKKGDEKK